MQAWTIYFPQAETVLEELSVAGMAHCLPCLSSMAPPSRRRVHSSTAPLEGAHSRMWAEGVATRMADTKAAK